jgi:hypothetical protein
MDAVNNVRSAVNGMGCCTTIKPLVQLYLHSGLTGAELAAFFLILVVIIIFVASGGSAAQQVGAFPTYLRALVPMTGTITTPLVSMSRLCWYRVPINGAGMGWTLAMGGTNTTSTAQLRFLRQRND